MSFTDSLLLTIINTAICLALPKLISLVFAVKSKANNFSNTNTIALKNQAKTI